MDFNLNKKGQVTIFVIVSVLIVAVISMIFILRRGDLSLRETDFDDPQAYLSLCIRERANTIIEEMLAGGGFIGKNDTVLYMDEEITYLCKNINNFEPCINQYPLYVTQVEKEFNNQIEDDVEQCFDSLKQDWKDKKYDFKSTPLTVETRLKQGIIEITIKSDVTISKDDIYRTYDRFDTYVSTRLYDISKLTHEIVSSEANECYFNPDEYMLLHREFDIRSFLLDDTTNIYTIKYKETGETLKMAVRGCVTPSGFS